MLSIHFLLSHNQILFAYMLCIKLYCKWKMLPNYSRGRSRGRWYISFPVIHFSLSHTSYLCLMACWSPGLRRTWKHKKGINQGPNKSSDSFQSFLILFESLLGLFAMLNSSLCKEYEMLPVFYLPFSENDCKSLHLKNCCCVIYTIPSFLCWSVAVTVLSLNCKYFVILPENALKMTLMCLVDRLRSAWVLHNTHQS